MFVNGCRVYRESPDVTQWEVPYNHSCSKQTIKSLQYVIVLRFSFLQNWSNERGKKKASVSFGSVYSGLMGFCRDEPDAETG